MDKEDHSTIICDTRCSLEFLFLWESIAASFDFLLVKYKKPEIEEEEDEKSNYFYEENFLKKIYNLKPNEKVIYHDSEQQIIMVIKNSMIFGKIYAVKDEIEPNRYFIGFNSFAGYTNVKTIGMIVYFDDNGSVNKKIILRRELCNVDCRNGQVVTYLSKQSIIFKQIHRDTKALMLDVVLLSYYDEIIENEHYYFEKIKGSFSSRNSKIVIKNRFINIETGKENYLFDMESSRVEEKNKLIFNTTKKEKELVITSYKLSYEDLDKLINNKLEKFYDDYDNYNDKYPTYCIKCNEVTAKANFSCKIKNLSCATSFQGLGNSYCHNCKIRYSKTNKVWECCKLKKDNENICSCEVKKDEICSKEHSESVETKIQSYGEPYFKFPYKKNLELTN